MTQTSVINGDLSNFCSIYKKTLKQNQDNWGVMIFGKNNVSNSWNGTTIKIDYHTLAVVETVKIDTMFFLTFNA